MTPQRWTYRLFQWSAVPVGIALLGMATMQPLSQAQDPSKGGPNDPMAVDGAQQQEGTQVLTRGPIHEAFGQPTVFNPKPGLNITKKPPQNVEELPPDEKPEGDNVAWLGGYWSWDEDKSDFLWVSGFWRVLPPGRQWMPGYWSDNAGQFTWVSGYWANAAQQQQEVISQPPPDTLEQGAPPTAPSQEHIWAPGCWVYRDTKYLWRPGYWVVNQPGWAWVPATYTWSPGGYIYVDGYWDWSIRRRGILFAPCYFDAAVVYRPGYYYRPRVCLDIELITPHFFCRPAYSHYYFGDYYATSYLSVGITPWFSFSVGRGSRFYSCDYTYYECHYRRTNPNWSVEIRLGYERGRDNVAYRPARTYVNQQTVINNITINNNKTTIINNNANNMALAKPMKTYTASMAKNPDAPIKYEKINDTKARDFAKTATETRKVGQERVTLEKNLGSAGSAPGKTGSSAGSTTAIRTLTMPKSPIVSKVGTNPVVENSKTPNVGSIGGQVTKTPPPIPDKSSRIGPVTGMTGTGTTGTGTTGTGSTAGTGTGSKTGSTGTGTVGGTTGTGSTSKSGTVGGSSSTGKTGSGSGTKSGGSSSGSGSKGSSSSGSGGKKDKDKP